MFSVSFVCRMCRVDVRDGSFFRSEYQKSASQLQQKGKIPSTQPMIARTKGSPPESIVNPSAYLGHDAVCHPTREILAREIYLS